MPQSLNWTTVVVTPFQQNCTIVSCAKTKKCAVIDPGGEINRILAEIKKHDLIIEKIWVTHGHLDHCGGVKALKAATGALVEGPQKEDLFLTSAVAAQGLYYGIEGMEDCTPDRWLEEGDQVKMGELTFDILHCPGHTPGHVIFYNKENNFAQVGDVLFKNSIGRTDFPRGNTEDLINSITKKLWPLGDVFFVPGHGPTSTFGEERKSNPFVADNAL